MSIVCLYCEDDHADHDDEDDVRATPKLTRWTKQSWSVRASDDNNDVDSCIGEINAILCKQWPWRDELWKQLIINQF